THLQFDGRLASGERLVIDALHQSSPDAPALAGWRDRQFAEIEAVVFFLDENATDQIIVNESGKAGFIFCLLLQALRRQQMRRRWRIDQAIHIGKTIANDFEKLIPTAKVWI